MVIQDGMYNGVRIAKPSTIALMKTDQLPLNLGPDDLKNHGWTFGYMIKRREVGDDPLPAGTIFVERTTGPVFFIDLKNEVVAILMCQTLLAYPLEFRKDFRKWVMKSLVE